MLPHLTMIEPERVRLINDLAAATEDPG